MSLKITGKLPTGKLLQSLQQSPNYKNGAFQNLSPTAMKPEDVSYWKMMKEFFKKHPETAPSTILPFVKTDLKKLEGEEPLIVWFGHSSYLIRIANKNFLIDPVFSGNAAPVSYMVKAFPGSNEYKAEDMPPIDYLILTHDHYDHLDFKTIRKLKSKIGNVICSLGISSHLKHWGIAINNITELDWWQTTTVEDNIQITAAPARHFSGRGIKRGQTLWSSFILKTSTHNLYIGGDSGYDSHFKEIGEKHGPFDMAILECGQYNTMWPLIHMMPEETAQAAVDLKAKALLPVHWGKFKLGMHPWNESIKRVTAKAKDLGMPTNTPKIGEPLTIGGEYSGSNWWE
ncbi:MBL fold metallo-hydrolase [Chitinophagaceae bacterium IBVUCB2]|nr:MBL fold metallo-hydrolase [Chitinophagaceae bacterium IBVUCB2]